jgi:Arc/MetJ-type ribon-helix-helix transcriptional regulator
LDNDDAADFVGEVGRLDEGDRSAALRAALTAAVAEDDYLDADLGSVAVAAAALVADGEYDDLGELARQALVRVLEDDSELAQLWAERGDDNPWPAEISELRQALSS